MISHLAEGDPKFAKTKPADFIESGPLAELDRKRLHRSPLRRAGYEDEVATRLSDPPWAGIFL